MTQTSQRSSTSYSFNISWISTNEGGVNTSRYEQIFNPPIFLDSTDYEIAVISLETYYSFPNITEGVNNKFGYKANPGDPTTVLSLPTGSYAITDIASEIQRTTQLSNQYLNFHQVIELILQYQIMLDQY